MANQLVLPVTPAQLPQGFCPTDYQDMLNLFSQNQTVIFPDTFEGLVVSSTAPVDTTRVWLQLDSLGRQVRIYSFSTGAWLSLHPLIPGITILWSGALPDFTTFDGGDANPISAISGPMWELAAEFAARVPIGVGTLPSTTVVNVGDTGGEERHTLLPAETPPHSHFVANTDADSGSEVPISSGTSIEQSYTPGGNQAYTLQGTTTTPTVGLSSVVGGSGIPPVTSPHNTLPPYVGVYFLRRTARLFYAA